MKNLAWYFLWSALLVLGLVVWTAAPASTDIGPLAQQNSTLPPGVPYAAPSDPIVIARIDLPPGPVNGGDTVSGRVITSSNVAALTARVGSYVIGVPKIAPGTFALAVRVPHLPLPSYRARIIITAIRADGLTLEQTIALKIRY